MGFPPYPLKEAERMGARKSKAQAKMPKAARKTCGSDEAPVQNTVQKGWEIVLRPFFFPEILPRRRPPYIPQSQDCIQRIKHLGGIVRYLDLG